MLTMLKTSMRVLGFTNRDVERKLGLSSSYLSRLFSGLIELKFQHIVDISRAIGMEPEEMLHFAYPQQKQPPTDAAVRMRSLISGAPQVPSRAAPAQPPAQSTPTQEEIEEMMTRTIRKLFGEIAKSSSG
jgi:transcriptional regulator with XRE-family HTH domain